MTELMDEKGMSLLEVMVAMFIVALISSSLMGGFIISNKMIKQAEQETLASSYAYAILEDLRAQPPSNWMQIAVESAHGSKILEDLNENYGSDMQAYISLNEKSNVPLLYDVQVTVTWKEEGACRMLEMVTLLNAGLREETI